MKLNERGFLILEMLIAGLILTASIAATMYLFKLGFEHLERANDSNVISSKAPQAINLIKTMDLERGRGTEYMGDDVALRWEALLLEKYRPLIVDVEFGTTTPSRREMYLYRVLLKIEYKKISRGYELNVFRHKMLGLPENIF